VASRLRHLGRVRDAGQGDGQRAMVEGWPANPAGAEATRPPANTTKASASFAIESGRPITFGGLFGVGAPIPGSWRTTFDIIEAQPRRRGGRMFAQVHSRALKRAALPSRPSCRSTKWDMWRDMRKAGGRRQKQEAVAASTPTKRRRLVENRLQGPTRARSCAAPRRGPPEEWDWDLTPLNRHEGARNKVDGRAGAAEETPIPSI